MHFGLATFPHATHSLSTTPSSSAPSPSAQSEDRLTSCLPLTLRLLRPCPYLAVLQAARPMRPDANTQNTQKERGGGSQPERERVSATDRDGAHGRWGR